MHKFALLFYFINFNTDYHFGEKKNHLSFLASLQALLLECLLYTERDVVKGFFPVFSIQLYFYLGRGVARFLTLH